MNLKKISLKILFRRTDYLKKAIYASAILLAREISAISSKSSLLELSAEVKAQTHASGWKLFLIKAAEILLNGGDWLAAFAFASLLIALIVALVLINRPNKHLVIGIHHFNSQLRTIEEFIKNFKIKSARDLAEVALKDVEDSYMTVEEKNVTNAKIYWLIGQCRTDDGDPKGAYQCFVKSYRLSPTNKTYKERACTSLLFLGEEREALELANELLQEDSYSDRANAVKLKLDSSYSIADIKKEVVDSQIFRRMYVQMLMIGGMHENGLAFLQREFDEQPIPKQIDFTNIDYWEQVGRYGFAKSTRNLQTFLSEKPDYTKNKLLQYSAKLLELITDKIIHTEAITTLGYQVTLYYRYYAHYLLTYELRSLIIMRDIVAKLPQKQQDAHAVELLFSLAQSEQYEDVMNISSSIVTLPQENFFYFIKYMAANSLGRVGEAELFFGEYLKNIGIVGDAEVNNLIGFFNGFNNKKEKITGYYNTHITPLTFASEIDKKIVFCYTHRYIDEAVQEIEVMIPELLAAYPSLRQELQQVILVILQVLNKHEQVNELIDQFHDWRSNDQILDLYTINQLKLRDNGVRLLEVLKFRRDHLPDERLFMEELKIHVDLDSIDDILTVSELGSQKYPHNINFQFYRIYSLFKKNNKSRLEEYLTEELYSIGFTWKQKYTLSVICIESGKFDLGFELFYQETIKNYVSPAVKQQYIALLLTHNRNIDSPATVGIDTTVLVEINGKEDLVEVNALSIAENPYAKQMLGLKSGDSIDVTLALDQKSTPLKVQHIFDKYSGLFNKIRKEIESSDLTGIGLKSIKIDTSSPEAFAEQLIREFGESGDERKKHHEDAVKKYDQGEISFTELVRSSFNKVLDLIGFLTGPYSNGFRTIPLPDFNGIEIKVENEFVIDLPSTFVLAKMSERGVRFGRKFIVSQYAIDYLESELYDAQLYPEKGTMVITSKHIINQAEPTEYKERRIKLLENILKWIKENCETRFSNEKLNMSVKHPEIVRENDFYYNYLIDTVFLAFGRVLVSDDLVHHKHFKLHHQTISLEYFLTKAYPDIYVSECLPILIANHFVGIRINHDNLKAEFKKPVYGSKSTFDYCLENLPYPVNHDPRIIEDCIEFAKFIYLEPIPIASKKEYSQKVFLRCLKNFPDLQWLKSRFIPTVSARFHLLLPDYIDSVIDDATTALQILNIRF